MPLGVVLESSHPLKTWNITYVGVNSHRQKELVMIEAQINALTEQCLNYLRAMGLGVGLLLNFGPAKLDFKRIVGPAFQKL